jgi:hypothetical protein
VNSYLKKIEFRRLSLNRPVLSSNLKIFGD